MLEPPIMQLSWHRQYPAPRKFYPERRTAVEYLDREDVEAGKKEASYRDLEALSYLPAQFAPLRRAVLSLAGTPAAGEGRLRLVELGAGTGLIGRRLAKALAARGFLVELIATDIRPELLPTASTDPRIQLSRQQVDVLADPLPAGDIVFANLLLHHFEREDAARIFAGMTAAGRLGGAVFDLDRNRWAFHIARLILTLGARSPITVADGLMSVQQAFRKEELLDLARQAGITAPRLERYLGIRSLVWWSK